MADDNSSDGLILITPPSTAVQSARGTSSEGITPPPTAVGSSNYVRPSTSNPDAENVKVVVRCRPLQRKEVERNCKQLVQADLDNGSISVLPPGEEPTNSEAKTFSFDSVFSAESIQADIYNKVARPIVENVLQGYNGTIFAYGQTGTGKTFTMEGVHSVPELKGIIPNSFAQIFSHIAKSVGDQRFLVRCSYLEIYNEDVRDLLTSPANKTMHKKLEVKEHKNKGVYVKDLSSFVVRNTDDMDKILAIGNKNRSVASTNMNSVSSRSHAIFTITVECSMEYKPSAANEGKENDEDKNKRSFRVGKLNLVDLAGSERLAKTQATGDRLKEATRINLSLSNLGNVISALVEGSSHIPYRNSKLTRLLQDSLGGNSKTVMVANIGPADYNYDETISTLRFANRAKNIKNVAYINEDPKDTLLREYEKQINELRTQLQSEFQGQIMSMDGLMMMPDGHEDDDADDDEDNDHPDAIIDTIQELPLPEESINTIKDELSSHSHITTGLGSDKKTQHQVLVTLKDKMHNYKQSEMEKVELFHKFNSLNKKILIGGENLLDKSQQQEDLLLRSMDELSLRKQEEVKLKEHLEQQEEERSSLEGRILHSQDEIMTVVRKTKRAWSGYQSEKNELEQVTLEYQEETETMKDQVQKIHRELQYHNFMIDQFIPKKYQELIEKHVKWNEDLGEWSLGCVAYAGCNMTRGHDEGEKNDTNDDEEKSGVVDLSSEYLDLEAESAYQVDQSQTQINRPGTSSSSTRSLHQDTKPLRSKTSLGGRKTADRF